MGLITCPGCDTSISDQAPVCPNCGRSLKSRSNSKAGCVGCSALLVIMFAIALIVIIRNVPDAVSKLRPAPNVTPAEKARQTALATLQAEGFADPNAAARLCEQAGPALPDELRARCAAAHIAQARRALEAKEMEQARKAMEAAIAEGVPADSRRDVEMRMQDIEAKMKRDVAVQMRRRLAEELGAKLDASVLVLGIDADRIRLRSDRVDAAWSEEFRKSEEARELREAGFTRVELRGPHSYREDWEWGGMPTH